MKILEKDEKGIVVSTVVSPGRISKQTEATGVKDASSYRKALLNFLAKLFLPAGYPNTVTPDYIRYQTFDVLQAFCSSWAAMLSSRAVLEVYGVGDASASATDALLFSVLLDIFGRVITITAAYYLGSSLGPEAKTWRFMADVFIDASITIDTLAPLLMEMSIFVFLTEAFPIPFRVYLFIISSAFRALCGIAAGGSKTAINLHFATPLEGTGDIADFNTKDASLETVLSLTGMLVGAFILPYITTRFATYTALAILMVFHLSLNYTAVRGVVLRTLNRQRACLAWAIYRSGEYQSGAHNGTADDITPSHISKLEQIFHRPDRLVDLSGKTVGRCKIGSSLASISLNGQASDSLEKVFDILRREQYVLWFDPACLSISGSCLTVVGKPRLHIFLREGYSFRDQLKAWVHATELTLMKSRARRRALASASQTPEELIASSYRVVDEVYPNFLQAMHQKGWVPTNDENLELMATLLPGPPRSIIVGIHDVVHSDIKKQR